MIRVMLVDDEPFVCMAIRTIFCWEAYGFQIIGESNNGEAALQKLKICQPDLILTDLKMPIMDGIGLISSVKRNYPDIRCVVLSNYDDFDLTRNAFLAGAVDYLLKNDLNEANFAALAERLKNRYFQHLLTNAPQKTGSIEINLAQHRAQALRQTVNGEIPSEPDATPLMSGKRCVLCKVCLERKRFIPVAEDKWNTPLIQGTVHKIFSEISELPCQYYTETPDRYVLLLVQDQMKNVDFRERLQAFFSLLEHNLSRYLNVTTVMGVSLPICTPEALPSAYTQASALTEYLFYASESKLLFAQADEKPHTAVSKFVDQSMNEFSAHIQRNDFAFLHLFIAQLFKLTQQSIYPPSKLKQLLNNLIFFIKTEPNVSSGEQDEHFSHQLDLCMENIMDANKMEAMVTATNQALALMENIRQNNLTVDLSPIATEALQYLHKSYSDADVTLLSTAKKISVNPSYLSRLFTAEVHQGFNRYLNSLRLECARRLLLTTRDSISNIAEQSGYANTKYFVNLFKKVEGVTPNIYRKNGGASAARMSSK